MKLLTLLTSLLLISSLEARRSGGGGGGRRGGSSGGIGSWFSSGSKPKSQNPGSYPKQTWSQSGTGGTGGTGTNFGGNKQGSYGGSSIGGGGFTNPSSNRGWSNPNVGRSHGYYGAGGQSIFGSSGTNYNYRRAPFGGFSGSRGLAVGAGAGFIGGAVAGVAAVSMYHQYRQYQGMMYCYGNPACYGGGYGSYGGYGYGGYGHRRILINHDDCIGGCPNQAYCDIGICRCREGYEAKYGQCWKNIDDYNARQSEWTARAKSNYNPYHGCSQHKDCRDVDMNMVCTASKCACRKDMQWNDEVQECQIFVNVNCTDIDVGPKDDGPVAAALTDNSSLNGTLPEYDYDATNGTADESDGHNSTDLDNPFDKEINVTSLTANETLIDSELVKIDLNKTSEKEIRAAFCREVAKTVKRYAPDPPQRRSDPSSGGVGTGVSVVIAIACIAVVGCLIYGLVKMCSRKGNRGVNKQESRDYDDDDVRYEQNPLCKPSLQIPNDGNVMAFSALQEPPPYAPNDQGGYPQVPVPYPPGPDNPYNNQPQGGYPGYQQPPQGVGYPPAPYGAPQQAPYPYPGGQEAYQPAPGVPYPPGPGAPYPPGAGAPYPPGPGAPYPPGPGAPYPPGQGVPYPPQ